MATINRTVLKEFQETNFQSFSDGQISITFPDENDLTKVDVVLTPTGGYYKGGTFCFAVNLPSNYPESVASINCRTKIFHPNIDFTGYICFNILNDEWNSSVRLVDYAHALLWLLYQPNLGSRLNGAVPGDVTEYADLVHKSLQGKTVAGISFPQMIPPEPEPVVEELSMSVAQLVAMFNAPRPPPPPPLGFRMRIPTTTPTPATPAPAQPTPTPAPTTAVAAPVAATAPPAPPAPPMPTLATTTTIAAPVTLAATPAPPAPTPSPVAVDPREAEAEAEAEAEDEVRPDGEMDESLPPRAERQVRALKRSSERVAASSVPRQQRQAGPNQEKRSAKQAKKRRGNRRGNKRGSRPTQP